jgi:hypothetical protein
MNLVMLAFCWPHVANVVYFLWLLMNLVMLSVCWSHVTNVVYILLACKCLYNAGHKLDGFRVQF